MTPTPSVRSITFMYYSANGLFTLAASLIWGVNTLFLMHAGLDIFEVMVVNASFTVGSLVFEVPTGVIADTLGRKTSFALANLTLVISTLMYVGAERYRLGIGWFIAASLLIGLGFTFQTGAVDAWLVDALHHVGHQGPLDTVFARGGAMFGAAMLIGSLAGGLLGQIDLAIPYFVRAAILSICLVYAVVMMRDVGFQPRPLVWRSFGMETRRILNDGVRYGWRHPVVRPLFVASLAQGTVGIFAFYSMQPYFLELLARNAVWVAGAITSLSALAGILGNSLAPRIRRSVAGDDAGKLLVTLAVAGTLLTALIGLVGLLWPADALGLAPFVLALALWLSASVAGGVGQPVRQAFLNRQIPSDKRATVLSVDSFFADAGASGGQLGLGWLARTISIPAAWIAGGVLLALAIPSQHAAARADRAGGAAAEE
ncbi:MAG: MFS transporter [Coriobacteriia bacterium]